MIKLYIGHRRTGITPERLEEMKAAAVKNVRSQLKKERGEDVELEAVDSYDGMVEGCDLIYMPDTLREWAELNCQSWEEIKGKLPYEPTVVTVKESPKIDLSQFVLPKLRLYSAPWKRAKN